MATFEIGGLSELSAAFNRAASPPEDVKREILQAMGEVAKTAVAQEGRTKGIFSSDDGKHMLDSIALSKPKITANSGAIFVTFRGYRKDSRHKKKTRQSTVAFVNEYGTQTQRARPFVSPGLKKKTAEIVSAGAKVYARWIDELNGRN